VHVDEVTDNKVTNYIGKFVRITNDVPTYLHMDTLGSAQTGTNANGGVAWREQYTPFGTTLTNPLPNNNQAGFTGHIKDSATGLNYMQAQYYDPLIGRFLSVDPVGFSPGRPQMFNRYAYTYNDPMNATDPTGLVLECSSGGCQNEQGQIIYSFFGNLARSPQAVSQFGSVIEELSTKPGFQSDAEIAVRGAGGPLVVGFAEQSGAGYFDKINEKEPYIGIYMGDLHKGYRVSKRQTRKLAGKVNAKSIMQNSTERLSRSNIWFLKAPHARWSLKRLMVHETYEIYFDSVTTINGAGTNEDVIKATNRFMMEHYKEPARVISSHDDPHRVMR